MEGSWSWAGQEREDVVLGDGQAPPDPSLEQMLGRAAIREGRKEKDCVGDTGESRIPS